jgi:hypothetical protein
MQHTMGLQQTAFHLMSKNQPLTQLYYSKFTAKYFGPKGTSSGSTLTKHLKSYTTAAKLYDFVKCFAKALSLMMNL